MAGSSEEMNNHDDKVKRPENAPENSNTRSPGAPRGHRKKDAEVMIDRVVREKFPRLGCYLPGGKLSRWESGADLGSLPSAHTGARTMGKEF